MAHDEIPAYSIESLREHAERIRDIATRMDADEVDETLAEVDARIAASESIRHPEFDLDVPDTEDAWHAWSHADTTRSATTLGELADAMDAAAETLQSHNDDAHAEYEESRARDAAESEAAEAAVRAAASARGLTTDETETLRVTLLGMTHGVGSGFMRPCTHADAERAVAAMDLFTRMSREGASARLITAVVQRIDIKVDHTEATDVASHLNWADELAAGLLGVKLGAQDR